jgi:hypothetical protein
MHCKHVQAPLAGKRLRTGAAPEIPKLLGKQEEQTQSSAEAWTSFLVTIGQPSQADVQTNDDKSSGDVTS